MTTVKERHYHYTECGLDNIWLVNGVTYLPGGEVSIEDIEGLHNAIGRMLVTRKANLSGKEIRFLRHEMGMSQATLAYFLRTTEQTVARWEKGKTEVPKLADSVIRGLYQAQPIEDIRKALKQVADLEHEVDLLNDNKVIPMRHRKQWQPEFAKAA